MSAEPGFARDGWARGAFRQQQREVRRRLGRHDTLATPTSEPEAKHPPLGGTVMGTRVQHYVRGLRLRDAQRLGHLVASASPERLRHVLVHELSDRTALVDFAAERREDSERVARHAALRQGLRITRTLDGAQLRAEIRQEAV